MRNLLLVLMATIAGTHAACGEDTGLQGEAQQVASELVQRLGAALKKELSQSGPEGAISVCRDTAPALAGELSRRTGWKVARVSLRARNPLLGQPDAWEQGILKQFDQAVATGSKPETLQVSEVVTEPQGRYFRYMKALPVQPLCLACHGNTDTIAASVQARLAADYPHDQARGYALGQVRGAVTIKRLLAPEP